MQPAVIRPDEGDSGVSFRFFLTQGATVASRRSEDFSLLVFMRSTCRYESPWNIGGVYKGFDDVIDHGALNVNAILFPGDGVV